MKAVLYTRYGPADVLRIEEIAKPVPKDNEVLVKIHETIVTPSDIAMRTADPFMIRFFSGLLRPRGIPGTDLAGMVEAVGAAVSAFKPGDRVFGSTSGATGAHAEYISLPEDGILTTIPPGLAFEETAGACDAAMTALTFLRDKAGLRSGQTILINGASGSVGTFAVQLAKHFGAVVTGVCSAANAELVRSLGADRVIDYTREDFTRTGETYDVVFDAVGKSSFPRCKKSLKPGGIYLTTVPSLAVLLQMLWTARSGGQRAIFAATGLNQTIEKLNELKEMLAAGTLKSVVDRRYRFDQIADAHRYVETGHKKGNVVVTI